MDQSALLNSLRAPYFSIDGHHWQSYRSVESRQDFATPEVRLINTVVLKNMKRYLIILCAMLAGCASIAHSTEPRIIGRWAFEDDLDEYSGLYVYEFTTSGKILLHDYPAGWKPGDKISTNEFGEWALATTTHPSGERIRLKFRYWHKWGESVFTPENWLKPVSGHKQKQIRLIPIAIVDGVPRGEGIEKN